MAGLIEVCAGENSAMGKPEFHPLDALAGGADVAAGAAQIAAFGGEAVIGGESDDASPEDFWGGGSGRCVIENAPADGCVADIK